MIKLVDNETREQTFLLRFEAVQAIRRYVAEKRFFRLQTHTCIGRLFTVASHNENDFFLRLSESLSSPYNHKFSVQ